jgi:hypothetical protein
MVYNKNRMAKNENFAVMSRGYLKGLEVKSMAKVRCAGCSFTTKSKLMGGVPELYCPNCKNERLGYFSTPEYGKHFVCFDCRENWRKVPCPKCGTGIVADSVSLF